MLAVVAIALLVAVVLRMLPCIAVVLRILPCIAVDRTNRVDDCFGIGCVIRLLPNVVGLLMYAVILCWFVVPIAIEITK